MKIRIIQSGSEDYEQMIGLRVHALLEPIGVPASYIDREKEKEDIFIGAFEDHLIRGCCILTKRNDEIIHLRQMAVLPGLQGKGIGTAIIHFAERIARDRNFKILMMHARDQVIGFYEKCGYVISGEQFFEVGIGHHKMEKQF
jgi:GNAT superfamily N-acetyltransferase